MFQTTCNSSNRSLDIYSHKYELQSLSKNGREELNPKHFIAEQVRMESRKNWMLITQMRNDIRNENRYMITKRQEIAEALKETMRINNAIK